MHCNTSVAAAEVPLADDDKAAADAGTSRWRDLVKVHPAADLFPMMSDDELEELGQDIKANGLRQEIIWWTPESQQKVINRRLGDRYERDVQLLDGRNRLAAMEKIGIQIRNRIPMACGGTERGEILYGGDNINPVDPYTYVVSANLQRRHLTGEQKRELIAKLLKESPSRSDRATARLAKVSDKTVGVIREKLEATAEIPQLEKTIGADGKARSSTRKATSATTPREPAAMARSKAVSSFSTLLHTKLADTLEDLSRMLGDERSRITAIPIEKRIALARGYLSALGIDLNDLRPLG